MSLLVRDVICRAMRLLGALGSGDTPTADEMTDAMTAINALKASWFGALIGGRITEQTVAAGAVQVQAENGGEYAIPAGAAYTVSAPFNPRSGARFGVVDGGLSFAVIPCTVNPNGRLIVGAAASLSLSTSGQGGRWWYRGDTGDWTQEADWGDPSDAVEFPEHIVAYIPYMLAVALAPEFNTELRQDVIAANAEGRAVMARTYAPRGRNTTDAPIGLPWPPPMAVAQAVG